VRHRKIWSADVSEGLVVLFACPPRVLIPRNSPEAGRDGRVALGHADSCGHEVYSKLVASVSNFSGTLMPTCFDPHVSGRGPAAAQRLAPQAAEDREELRLTH
jgi:hypothetical protein